MVATMPGARRRKKIITNGKPRNGVAILLDPSKSIHMMGGMMGILMMEKEFLNLRMMLPMLNGVAVGVCRQETS